MNAVLVGAGNWGEKVAARAVQAGHTLVGVIDENWSAKEALAARYGISSWKQPAELALICTPPYEGRPEQVRSLMARGVTRFHLAKPACTTRADLDELRLLSHEVMVTVGFTTLYANGARAFRLMLTRMEAPRIEMFRDSVPPPAHEGDPLFDLAPHDLAQVMFALGIDGWTVEYCTSNAERYDLQLRRGDAMVALHGGWGFETKRRLAVASSTRLSVLFDDLGLRGTPSERGDPLTEELRHAGLHTGYDLELGGAVVELLCQAKDRQEVAA